MYVRVYDSGFSFIWFKVCAEISTEPFSLWIEIDFLWQCKNAAMNIGMIPFLMPILPPGDVNFRYSAPKETLFFSAALLINHCKASIMGSTTATSSFFWKSKFSRTSFFSLTNTPVFIKTLRIMNTSGPVPVKPRLYSSSFLRSAETTLSRAFSITVVGEFLLIASFLIIGVLE